MDQFAICCESGTFKGIFIHGVLSAFEEREFIADAYGCSSSSTIPSCLAAVGLSREVGLKYWTDTYDFMKESVNDLSSAVFNTIENYAGTIKQRLFDENAKPRIIIATSFVNNDQAASLTQGEEARKLGKVLLISSMKKDRSWVDRNLNLHLYDTNLLSKHILDGENFNEVMYATTRMLHAWKIPAFINKQPYIDGSYTSSCPVIGLSNSGFDKIIAISTSPGPTYTDLFEIDEIGDTYNQTRILHIKPEIELEEMGVDFTSCTQEGFEKVYRYGMQKGFEFLSSDL